MRKRELVDAATSMLRKQDGIDSAPFQRLFIEFQDGAPVRFHREITLSPKGPARQCRGVILAIRQALMKALPSEIAAAELSWIEITVRDAAVTEKIRLGGPPMNA